MSLLDVGCAPRVFGTERAHHRQADRVP
eukprot:COSAG02_NODE_39529_length_416_cov_0.656151_1_plen_27_part_01